MNVLTKIIQGKTIHYTRLGLGLAALGRPGYMTLGHAEDLPTERTQEAMMLHAMGVLDAAWAAGVRYYDVARSYGAGELFLSTWLRIRNIAPDQATVGSKWGYTYTAQWKVQAEQHEVKDHCLATLRRQIGESSTLLGPWLKLYQIHSATLESGVLEKSDVLDELARLQGWRPCHWTFSQRGATGCHYRKGFDDPSWRHPGVWKRAGNMEPDGEICGADAGCCSSCGMARDHQGRIGQRQADQQGIA